MSSAQHLLARGPTWLSSIRHNQDYDSGLNENAVRVGDTGIQREWFQSRHGSFSVTDIGKGPVYTRFGKQEPYTKE